MPKKPTTVGSRELKTRLGTYLERVRRGETLLVTDHGTPVAELRPVQTARDATEAALQRMEAEGLITRATPGALTRFEPIRPRRGASVSELVRADRDGRGF